MVALTVLEIQGRIGHPPHVADLLPLRVFKDAQLRAGEAGLRRKVTAVTVGEVPDHTRFLRGGEVLLTSLFAYRDAKTQDLQEFIEAVDDHGASAVAFKPGRFVPDLPREALRAADERGLPLIALPADVVWSDVIQEVSSLLLSRAGIELATIRRAQAELSQALLAGGVADLVRVMSYWLRGPVLLLDHNFTVVAQTKDAEPLDRASLIEQLGGGRTRTSRGQPLPIRAGSQSGIAQVLTGGDRALGYLLVWGRMSLDADEALIADQGAVLFSTELVKRQAIESVSQVRRGDLIDDLLVGAIQSQAEFRQRLRQLGQGVAHAYSVVMLAPLATAEGTGGRSASWSAARNELIETVSALTTVRDGRLVVLWPSGQQRRRELYEQVKSFLTSCRRLTGWHDCRAAIGRLIVNPLDARRSYQDALRGWEALISETDVDIVTADRFAVERLLDSVPKEELQRFRSDVLGRLLAADGNNQVLLKTLSTYLATNRSWKKTSFQLGVHRNTLTNRLRQIEQITEVDLHDPRDLMNMQVALHGVPQAPD
jgi:purine catabolism regulator